MNKDQSATTGPSKRPYSKPRKKLGSKKPKKPLNPSTTTTPTTTPATASVSFIPSNDVQKLQDVVEALKELPESQFIEAIGKARMGETEKYIKELDSSRKKHPILQDTGKFNIITDALRSVNGRKTTLISIDLEAFERNTEIVTEIGISIYDPVKEATSLVPSIINIHLILKETIKLRNGAFVHDHKDNFLGGSSLVVSKKTAVELIESVLEFYCVQRKAQGYEAAFVGHNLSGDLNWLKKLGVHLPQNPHILDTEKVYSASHGSQGNSLGAILKRLRIPHSFLHNAGNDAYFTLIALLKLSDPHCRRTEKLDSHEEDLKYTELSKQHELQLKAQREQPKRINRPRKALKSHEFSPYVEYFSYQDALLKVFEHY